MKTTGREWKNKQEFGSDWAEYVKRCDLLLDDPTLKNELAELYNKAHEMAAKKTKTSEELAFYRGQMNAVETLEQQLKKQSKISNYIPDFGR